MNPQCQNSRGGSRSLLFKLQELSDYYIAVLVHVEYIFPFLKDFFLCFQCTENWNEPLYRNARITLGQSVLLVMAFAVTVGLTQTRCSELLMMLIMFLPMDSLLPTTKYMLKKKYFQFKPESVILPFLLPRLLFSPLRCPVVCWL